MSARRGQHVGARQPPAYHSFFHASASILQARDAAPLSRALLHSNIRVHNGGFAAATTAHLFHSHMGDKHLRACCLSPFVPPRYAALHASLSPHVPPVVLLVAPTLDLLQLFERIFGKQHLFTLRIT